MSALTMPQTGARTERRFALWRRAVLSAATAAGLLLCSAGAASAHVRVIPESTTAGGFAALTFRVPTESETAGTVALRVELPTDTPFTSVRTKPLAGWTAVIERGPLPEPIERDGATITEAATAVVWTAEPGTQVGPGQYQEFDITVGPLPEAGTEVLLPATQTYSDGEVVAWAEEALADGSEPELPAPVLVTTAGEESDDAHGGGAANVAASQDTDEAAPAAPAASAEPSQDGTARLLGAGGLLLGVIGLVVGTIATRRANAQVRS